MAVGHGDGGAAGDADVEGVVSGSSSGTILKSDDGIAVGPALPFAGGDVAIAGIAIDVGMAEEIEASVGDDDGVAGGLASIGGVELIGAVGAGVVITVGVATGAGGSVGVAAGGSVTVGAGGSIGDGVGIGVKICDGEGGGDAKDVAGGRAELAGVVVAGVNDAAAAADSALAVGVGDVADAGLMGV
jgi:hypothetical protein